ncbi:hypothetical protein JL722_1372 [Aureococcus anophagefferens]|nr:hypothetical protein JL722_1372 [Aureococcus anophagefferens]
MLIAGLLVIVSLSPVRGPGPRATRLEAMAETLGTRARMAVLTCDGHEDAALSVRTLARANASAPSRSGPTTTVPRAENLACYLKARYDASTPHYVGTRMWGPCCGLFNSGAAGFAVSRASLDLLAARWALMADPAAVDDKCGPDRPKAQARGARHKSNTLHKKRREQRSLPKTNKKTAKNRIRDMDRRLRKLKSLDVDPAQTEKRYAERYRKIKFFERQKVTRRLKQLRKELAAAPSDDLAPAATLEDDLRYIKHYPKDRKYPKSAVDERLRAADEESMSADEVAKAFIPHYYNLFDTNREGLVSLFRETSSLTFEGDGPKTGVAQIMEKLRGCRRRATARRESSSWRVAPRPLSGSSRRASSAAAPAPAQIEQGKPLKYSEVFQLVASAPGQYYLNNVMFRFNYA